MIGPLDVSFIASAAIKQTGQTRLSANKAPAISKLRLMTLITDLVCALLADFTRCQGVSK